jgi:hypothetical protein
LERIGSNAKVKVEFQPKAEPPPLAQNFSGGIDQARPGANRKQYKRPKIDRIAPHQTLACNWNKTTGFAGGLKTSQIPAHKIRIPFTNSDNPIKNQIDITLPLMLSPALPYQKIILRMKNTTMTIAAQNNGFW